MGYKVWAAGDQWNTLADGLMIRRLWCSEVADTAADIEGVQLIW